ncbi:MAG: hypothetical protein AVDCRST_MAG05-3813 [uncultured Rubrobacteraceae bacterium]|uniref:Uncharacterized protein n=1 Tax=uncultured Rubrobacteraceae bacterium TaxID=349277 RepID=A0A6J4THN8_9ACTN|nr:MAG: hypothetical protein AVDCRST_MAG05-3813 [uncultured Rubrobacteraceae bacterium]
MQLKHHVGHLDEGHAHNLFYGLLDHQFAKRLLEMSGEEGRERFAEHGWSYGDPSYTYETDPFEVFVHQARVVAATLFAGRIRLQLFYYGAEDEDLDELLGSLVDREGLSIPPDERFPDLAGAYADFAVLVAEIAGDGEAIWRLKRALEKREVHYLHYDPATRLGADSDPSGHLVLLYDSEMYPEREVIHDGLFEALIRAKEDMGDALDR